MNPIIEMKDVNKHFGALHVLNNINLTVAKSEILVICGPSGSGKSTLIRTINVLEEIDSGQIIVDGILLKNTSKSIKQIRMKTGMVFQQFNLFPHMTVLDNCMFSQLRNYNIPYEEAYQKSMHILDKISIADQANKYPAQLSGGQQQRVAIARALVLEPQVMLFDEPTSALDPEMVGDVLKVMVDLAKEGMTMLCVTHEMGFAKQVADNIVFIDQGQIVEKQPPSNFFDKPQTERAKIFLEQILR